MRIVIVGAGKVGQSIARALAGEDNDIILVDREEETLRNIDPDLDVMSMRGNGLRTSVLQEVGVSSADLLIAATAADEVNMLCCLTGRRLGAPHTIARIRDPEYTQDLYSLQRELGLDLIINPEREAAAEITRVLRFPQAAGVEPFFEGRAELVAVRLTQGNLLVGQTLERLMSRSPESVVFCAVERDGGTIIPDGSFLLAEGDVVYCIGQPVQITTFFRRLGKTCRRVSSVLIVGGGRIGYYLTQSLLAAGISVKLLEKDEERCLELSESLPRAVIIHGDGSNERTMDAEDVGAYDAVVTLTGRDEENLLMALYAARMGVSKVVAKINREDYEGIIRGFGIDSIIRPKRLTAAQIVRYVRALKNTLGNNAETLYQIVGGKAEALEFIVTKNAHYLDRPLRDLPFRKDCLAAAILRDGRVIIPSGNDQIHAGDRLVVVTSRTGTLDLNDFFENKGK